MEKKARDVLARAIVAVTRCVGVEHPLYREALSWCLDNTAYLKTTFVEPEGDLLLRMSWDSVDDGRRWTLIEDPDGSLRLKVKVNQKTKAAEPAGKNGSDALLWDLMKRHGRSVEEFEALRRRYYRWKERHDSLVFGESQLSQLLYRSLRHLSPEPRGEQERAVAAANGVLLDWYI